MSAISSDNGQDFDLNLAPIIDCFTVLITYLLVSASFISLIVLDVGVAAVGPSDASKPVLVPPFNLMVELGVKKIVTLKVSGGPQNIDVKIPVAALASQDFDVETVKRQITDIEKKYPGLKEATLTAEPAVIYKDVVRVVEEMKTVIEKVFLSG